MFGFLVFFLHFNAFFGEHDETQKQIIYWLIEVFSGWAKAFDFSFKKALVFK